MRRRPALPAAAPDDSQTAPSRDRLVTTLFLAALLHGMVILGVTFSGDLNRGDRAPGLDVQLLAEGTRDEVRDRPAAYLAQASRVGTGTTPERIDARTPLGAPPQPPTEATLSQAPAAADASLSADLAVLTSSNARMTVRYSAPVLADSAAEGRNTIAEAAAALRAALAALDAGGEDPVDSAQLTGPQGATDGWVSPDTQASLVAPYLDAWRRRVERLGTLNYPTVARAGRAVANPVLEIELAASGALSAVRVRRSSGSPELDAAALQILRLGTPFDPFPADMAAAYPVLRFAYEWQFTQRGRLAVEVSQ